MHKKIAATAFAAALALIGCGEGVDDWSGTAGGLGNNIGQGNDQNNSNQGNSNQGETQGTSTKPPTIKSLWEYDEVNTSRFATIISTNTIQTGNRYNDAIMQVKIHRFVNSNGLANDYLTITVSFSGTACDVNCQLRYKKNGTTGGVYRVRESIDGVFNDTSFASGDMEKLIKAIKIGGKSSISVPLDQVPDAEFEFDFTGYDEKWMKAK